MGDIVVNLGLIVPKATGLGIFVSTSTTTRRTSERHQEIESPGNANEKISRVERVRGGVEEAKVLVLA